MKHTTYDTRHEPRRKTERGFTIIETLVAVTILMIAIAGPLTIASQSLHAAQDAKNQLIATNLAQESVEELRNYKDNNITGSTLSTVFANVQNPSVRYMIQANPNGSYIQPESCVSAGDPNCELYLSPSTGYSYTSTDGAPTIFDRWFNITPISSNEYLLTVTVTWTTGNVGNQVTIEDLLSNIAR